MKVRIIVSEDDGFVIADVYKQGDMLIDLLVGANMQLGQYLAGNGVAVLREKERRREDPSRCAAVYLGQRCKLSPGHDGQHTADGFGGKLYWNPSATEIRYKP